MNKGYNNMNFGHSMRSKQLPIFVIFLFLVLFLKGLPSLQAQDDLSTYCYRQVFVLDSTLFAGEEDIESYPLFIDFTSEELSEELEHSYDFTFGSLDGTTTYPFEILFWNRTTGSLKAWVEVPLLAAQDTALALYYGNEEVYTSQESNPWQYPYVFHGEKVNTLSGLGGSFSTVGNDNPSSSIPTASFQGTSTVTTTGKIGKGLFFNGNDNYLSFSNEGMSEGTLSCWIQPYSNFNENTATTQTLLSKYVYEYEYFSLMLVGNDHPSAEAGSLLWKVRGGNSQLIISSDLREWEAGKWYFVSITWKGNEGKLLVNEEEKVGTSTGAIYLNSTSSLEVGGGITGAVSHEERHYFYGVMDEIWLSDKALSTAQLLTHYQHQKEVAAMGVWLPATLNSVAPSVPTGLSALTVSDAGIDLSWEGVAGSDCSEVSYEIERTSADLPTMILVTGAGDTTYEDRYLLPDRLYTYRIRGVLGNEYSAYSDAVSATTGGMLPPTDFQEAEVGDTWVDLTWKDTMEGSNGFVIERSLSEATGFEEIYRTSANVTSFRDEGLLDLTRYYYRIQSVKLDLVSDYATTNLTTLQPATPQNLVAVIETESQVLLHWEDVSGSEDNFMIERKVATGTEGDFTVIANLPSNTESYLDKSVAALTTYTYRVRAMSSRGKSEYSRWAEVSTPLYSLSVIENQLEGPLLERRIPRRELEGTTDGLIPLLESCESGSYQLVIALEHSTSSHSALQDWQYQLDFDLLEEGGSNLLTNQSLVVSSDSDSLSTFLSSAPYTTAFTCEEARGYKLRINTLISSPATLSAIPADIDLVFRFYRLNVEELVDKAEGSFRFTGTQQDNQRLLLAWEHLEGATGYDLEWTFIDKKDDFQEGSAVSPFVYKEPVRVSLEEEHYALDLNYAEGMLYFRVRGRGVHPEKYSQVVTGAWHYQDDVTGSALRALITDESSYLPNERLRYASLEKDKNWQAVTTYAEEGKHKTVMSYYDGSVRNRQTLTNLNSTSQTLVAETLYDYEGRGVLNILPVPVKENSLSYRNNFNVFTGGNKEKSLYDNKESASLPLLESGGAGQYYSSNNDSESPLRDYIPSANGYAYTQTEFINDNTGRVRRQSGVGETFRLRTSDNGGNGKITHYFYGNAPSTELYRLFGSSVGKASHYKKQMVIDPNGQGSISYLDQEGRVIATGLVGGNPSNLEALPSLSALSGAIETVNLNESNVLNASGALSRSESSILNTETTTYTFTYDLLGDSFSEEEHSFCQMPCIYDLSIRIYAPDEQAVLLDSIYWQGSSLSDTSHLQIQDIEIVGCDDSGALTSGNYTLAFQVQLSAPGSYRVVKELKRQPVDIATVYEQLKVEYASEWSEILEGALEEADSLAADCEIVYEPTSTEEESQMDTAFEEHITALSVMECSYLENGIRARADSVVSNQEGADNYTAEELAAAIDAYMLAHPDPEYCHLQACQDEESNLYKHALSNIGYWGEEGFEGGYYILPIEAMREMQGFPSDLYITYPNDSLWVDPYFRGLQINASGDTTSQAGLGFGYVDEMLRLLSEIHIYDEDTGELQEETLSIWELINEKEYPDLFLEEDTTTQLEGESLEARRWQLFMGYYNACKEEIKQQVCAYVTQEDLKAVYSDFDFEPLLSATTPLSSDASFNSIDEGVAEMEAQAEEYFPSTPDAEMLGFQVNRLLNHLSEACREGFPEEDSVRLINHLHNYFSRPNKLGLHNPTAVILVEDVGRDPDLLAIDALIGAYEMSCEGTTTVSSAVGGIAAENLLSCKEEGKQRMIVPVDGESVNWPSFLDFGGEGQWAKVEGEGTALNLLDIESSYLVEAWIQIDRSQEIDYNTFGIIASSVLEDTEEDYRHASVGLFYDQGELQPFIDPRGVGLRYSPLEKLSDSGIQLDDGNCHYVAVLKKLVKKPVYASGHTYFYDYYFKIDDKIFIYPHAAGLIGSSHILVHGEKPADLYIGGKPNRSSEVRHNFAFPGHVHHVRVWKQRGLGTDLNLLLPDKGEVPYEDSALTAAVDKGLLGHWMMTSIPESLPERTYEPFKNYAGNQFDITNSSNSHFPAWKMNGSCLLYTNEDAIYHLDFEDEKYASVPHASSLNFQEEAFTLEAWVDLRGDLSLPYASVAATRSTSIPSENVYPVVSKGDSNHGGWSFGITTSGSLYLDMNGERITSATVLHNGALRDTFPNGLNSGCHHIAVTAENNSYFEGGVGKGVFRFYIDGEPIESNGEAEVIGSLWNIHNTSALEIGKSSSGAYFEGSIQNLRLWGTALSQETLSYQRGLIDLSARYHEGLLAGWSLLDVAGNASSLSDHSGNNHTLTLTANAPTWRIGTCLQAPLYGTVTYCKTFASACDFSAWDASELAIREVSCLDSNRISILIKNIGEGDMREARSLSLYDDELLQSGDSILLSSSSLQLTAGAEQVYELSYSSEAVRYLHLRLEQDASHPTHLYSHVVVEACRGNTGFALPTFYNTPQVLCGGNQSSVEINIESLEEECRQDLISNAYYQAEEAFSDLLSEEITRLLQASPNHCGDSFEEDFSYEYAPKDYHYTLYYYDQAGNLVQTVPPEGVRVLDNASVTSLNSQMSAYYQGSSNTTSSIYPSHEMVTRYAYNSLNQLVWQSTPDGGESRFWYDEKGMMRLSQNAKQKEEEAYSYTQYDEHGRIKEVGKITLQAYSFNDVFIEIQDNPDFPSRESTGNYSLSEITSTHYDDTQELSPPENLQQENLRGRVASVEVLEDGVTKGASTFYSYDEHGNVKTLVQSLPNLAPKRTDYEYDLVSGNVNFVLYQYGYEDQFLHAYKYDDDNRITDVYTSVDGLIWDREAKYRYYDHGPLARLQLGHYNVQGLDYYYTLQGWLKGVNTPNVNEPALDLSQDGYRQGRQPFTARDVFSYALGYYEGDYQPIGESVNLGAGSDETWEQLSGSIGSDGSGRRGLFNGNIAWMVTQLGKTGIEGDNGLQAMAYRYDQLNRIKNADSYEWKDNEGTTSWMTGEGKYHTDYSYDANGNLLSLNRKDGEANNLDNLGYDYYYFNRESNSYQAYNSSEANDLELTNRLLRVADSSGNEEGLATGQTGLNYEYDAIGNLIKDDSEGIQEIAWTVYGKVAKVTKAGGKAVTYRYDGAGNRISKSVDDGTGSLKVTRYVRDASGNIMAIYKEDTEGQRLEEQPIYGSSRLGVYRGGRQQWQRTLGLKSYELSNHLGNSLAIISDKKVPVDEDGDDIAEFYKADLLQSSDYYPFGYTMKLRSFGNDNYRYGFTGQEKEKDIFKGDGYAFKYRISNSVIGRFFATDPIKSKYPYLTPYQFASNQPIHAPEFEGLENSFELSHNQPSTPQKAVESLNTSLEQGQMLKSMAEGYIDGITYASTSVVSGLANGLSYGYGDLMNGNGNSSNTRWKAWGFSFNSGFGQGDYTSGNAMSFSEGMRLMGGTIDLLGLGITRGIGGSFRPFKSYSNVSLSSISKYRFQGNLSTIRGAGTSKSFYTVQSKLDATRLRTTGTPWPTEPHRAALGEGVYAWGSLDEAMNYQAIKARRGVDTEIVQFSIENTRFSRFSKLNVDDLPDPESWLYQHSKLFDGTPSHNIDYIQRGTNLGTEHYFRSEIFKHLKFK